MALPASLIAREVPNEQLSEILHQLATRLMQEGRARDANWVEEARRRLGQTPAYALVLHASGHEPRVVLTPDGSLEGCRDATGTIAASHRVRTAHATIRLAKVEPYKPEAWPPGGQ